MSNEHRQKFSLGVYKAETNSIIRECRDILQFGVEPKPFRPSSFVNVDTINNLTIDVQARERNTCVPYSFRVLEKSRPF